MQACNGASLRTPASSAVASLLNGLATASGLAVADRAGGGCLRLYESGLAPARAGGARAGDAVAERGDGVLHGTLRWVDAVRIGLSVQRILLTALHMRLNVAAEPRAIAGIGRVMLWAGGGLWIGRDAGRGHAHAHHAIQVSLALTGQVRLRSGDDGAWSEYTAAIVQSHHRHQFDGCGETVAQVFVEPETSQGRALSERCRATPISAVAVASVEALVERLRVAYAAGEPDEVLIAASHRIKDLLCATAPSPLGVDPRITGAIAFMRARLNAPVSLADAADVAHLSPSRFRHLFVAQTGVSFRAYLLWARLESAVGAAMGGLSWTESAQNWGFADSAHLSRTCRRMFGIAPSMLIREQAAAQGRGQGPVGS